ncbi:hypothetical protein [Arthrobacter sp. PM3]|uniref:hypothetical protein n=1 Tax=Arthrobacter sp. PM3 TaxID=2017685 RepID=UPI001ABF5CF7|nr:hypothetical protein [Arthrobacter sp. PM3]
MIEVLQWSTLAVCALVALLRLPSALRGENRSLFGIFVLTTCAMLLSLKGPYSAVDAWLGSDNVANLILRFVVYGTVLLAGYKIARAFNSTRSIRLITGPAGIAVLAAVAAATVVPFLLADTAGTSAGLVGLANRSPHNAQLIGLYAVAGRAYPGFVAACLLPATVPAARRRSRLPRLVRAGAAVLSVGGAVMVLLAASDLLPPGIPYVRYILSSAAVLGLVVGLALIWLGRVVAGRRAVNKTDFIETTSRRQPQSHLE